MRELIIKTISAHYWVSNKWSSEQAYAEYLTNLNDEDLLEAYHSYVLTYQFMLENE